MSDVHDFLFELESLHEKIKMEPKKKKKKKKKGPKQKSSMMEKTGNEKRRRRRKEESKFKTTMKLWKEKKKKKKEEEELKEALSLCPKETIQPDESRRKKKVLFDLSPDRVRVRRPKVSLLSLTEEGAGLETKEGAGQEKKEEAGQETKEEAGQETKEGAGQETMKWAGNDSQGSDVQSQDLFITQKIFQVSPPQTTFLTETSPEEPHSVSRLGPNRRTSPEASSQRTGPRSLEGRRRHKQNVPTQTETKHPGDRQTWSLGVNPFLDPVVVESSCRDSSTQTENFFTSELSSCRGSAHRAGAEGLQPLDLSLPHRIRAAPRGRCRTKEEPRPIQEPPGKRRAAEGWVESTGGSDSTPSPQSESEPKSGDMNTSSEDGEVYGRIGILTQVRTVQMRLNESFFFKTKGDAGSPRPASPLMKLAQDRDVKLRKRR